MGFLGEILLQFLSDLLTPDWRRRGKERESRAVRRSRKRLERQRRDSPMRHGWLRRR